MYASRATMKLLYSPVYRLYAFSNSFQFSNTCPTRAVNKAKPVEYCVCHVNSTFGRIATPPVHIWHMSSIFELSRATTDKLPFFFCYLHSSDAGVRNEFTFALTFSTHSIGFSCSLCIPVHLYVIALINCITISGHFRLKLSALKV